MLPSRQIALLTLGSLSLLYLGGSLLSTLSFSLIVVQDFILSHLVELADLVRLRHNLIEILQLFLLYQGTSNRRVSLLHLINFLVVRMGFLFDVLLLPILSPFLSNL